MNELEKRAKANIKSRKKRIKFCIDKRDVQGLEKLRASYHSYLIGHKSEINHQEDVKVGIKKRYEAHIDRVDLIIADLNMNCGVDEAIIELCDKALKKIVSPKEKDPDANRCHGIMIEDGKRCKTESLEGTLFCADHTLDPPEKEDPPKEE